MENELPFSELKIEEAIRLAVLGTTGSGKTHTIRNIVKDICSKFRVGSIWWYGTFSYMETWLQPKFRSERVDKCKIDLLRKAQRTESFKDFYQIVVLDDINGEDFYTKDKKWWIQFFTESRKDRIFCIIGLQFLLGSVPPALRNNIQQWVICDANIGTQKSLYELSRVRDTKAWYKAFEYIPKGFPVLLNTAANELHLSRLEFEKCDSEDMKN